MLRFLLGLAVALVLALPATAQTLRITQALAAPGDGGSTFPAQGGTTVTLPDDWAETRPDQGGDLWYRVGFRSFGTSLRGDLAALYIERACTNLEVYLNGQLVHAGGRMDDPLTHNCSHPQLVPLPAALVAPGANVIDVHVAGYPLAQLASRSRAGGLSALEIGPQSELAARHARATTLGVALPQALGATLVLMGGFMFVLGFINRRESHLAYFGALAVGWAVVDARLWLRSLPLPNSVAEFLLAAMLPFLTLAGVQFLLRYVRWRDRRVDRALLAQCALMPLALVVAGPQRLHAATLVCSVLLGLQALAAMAFHLQAQRRARSASAWPMALLLGALLAALVVEQAAVRLDLTPLAHLAHAVPPLLFVLLGLRLVQQHGRALQDAEIGKAHLEQRVREATAEIERNFRQLAELKVEQVTERERKRIAADLHDDLGAKLLTIVHTSDSERISTLAREALEEMRLSVRGLTGRPVRLADAVGDWRAEFVNRCAQAGIEAEWNAQDDLPQTL